MCHSVLISLVFVVISSIINFSRIKSNLLVILLKCSKILSCFRELSLLHTLTNIPVNKGSLGVHQIKLVVKSGPSLSNGGGIGEHTDGSLDLGEVTSRNHSWRLIVDTNLKTSWTPVNKLDASLGLDGGNGSIDILGDHISPVEHAAGHVFAMTRVTLDHLVGRLKASIGDLRDTELLMVSFLSRDNRGIGDQGEMNPGVGHQVGLELCKIHIESSVKPERGRDGGHNLTNQTVEVGVGWPLNIQVAAADVIDGLIVHHEGTVRVLQGGVGGQDGVVGLNHSCGHLRSWVDGELQFRSLSIIHRESLHQQGSKSRASSSTK